MCPAAMVKSGYVVRTGKRLSVVTKLFEGEEPPMTAVMSQDETGPPLAHPERRLRQKSGLPDMSKIPPPTRRVTCESRGPGRVPIVGKLRLDERSARGHCGSRLGKEATI